MVVVAQPHTTAQNDLFGPDDGGDNGIAGGERYGVLDWAYFRRCG